MKIITVDFETFYSTDYSLKKMSVEAYIRDPRFQVIMLGIRMPDGTRGTISGTHEEIKFKLDTIPWHEYAVLAHNTPFDAAIMTWVFNIRPGLWLDTLSMANAIHHGKPNSLEKLAERYNLPRKLDFIMNAQGKRLEDFTKSEFRKYAEYCLRDIDICYDLFQLMSAGWYDLPSCDHRDKYPRKELELIDAHIRMFTEPVLRLNSGKLKQHLADVQHKKATLLEASGIDKADLMSNPKFAAILESFGVSPPMKVSPTTKKLTYAFAKTDAGMKDLLEHPDERVQAIVAARMGVKSTLEETRTQRFIDIADRGILFPVPLKYAAARTMRSGGTDGINLQNLPSRGAGANKLKECIEFPPGHIGCNSDSSNIEARMLAWWAMQDDLVADFANGVDVYCKLASVIYNQTITKADKLERFVGKTVTLGCFAPDTQVLTDSGWKPIVEVRLSDRLWDGEEWVNHSGLLNQGYRSVETTANLMLYATPDHEILTEHGWLEWREVHSNRSLTQSALNRASLPLSIGSIKINAGIRRSLANVDGPDSSIEPTSQKDEQPGVIHVQNKRLDTIEKDTSDTLILYPTRNCGKACSTASQNAYQDVSARLMRDTISTAAEESECIPNGLQTEKSSCAISSRLMGGTNRSESWTESTTIEGTSPEILDGLTEEQTHSTKEPCADCKKKLMLLKKNSLTYDLLGAGPRNRFTVWTALGPIIVHNCGYQTGAKKLQVTLKAADPPVDLPDQECKRIIDTYRDINYMIPRLWEQAEQAIQAMHDNKGMWLGREGVVWVDGKYGIKLPNGMYIQYPQLHKQQNKETGRMEWVYKDRNGFVNIYGGKLVENITQALARIVVMYQLLKIKRRYKVALTVHDSVVASAKMTQPDPLRWDDRTDSWVANSDEAKEFQAYVEECMRWVPKWAQGCPINCESGLGYNYAEC